MEISFIKTGDLGFLLTKFHRTRPSGKMLLFFRVLRLPCAIVLFPILRVRFCPDGSSFLLEFHSGTKFLIAANPKVDDVLLLAHMLQAERRQQPPICFFISYRHSRWNPKQSQMQPNDTPSHRFQV